MLVCVFKMLVCVQTAGLFKCDAQEVRVDAGVCVQNSGVCSNCWFVQVRCTGGACRCVCVVCVCVCVCMCVCVCVCSLFKCDAQEVHVDAGVCVQNAGVCSNCWFVQVQCTGGACRCVYMCVCVCVQTVQVRFTGGACRCCCVCVVCLYVCLCVCSLFKCDAQGVHVDAVVCV